jgi:hypothetical protein
MMQKINKKIKTLEIILNLSKIDPNDYSLGYRIRRLLNLYKENREINEEKILKEKSKS